MADELDALLADALQHLQQKPKKPAEGGPAYPVRTQHHSPLESESSFVRYAGWWDEYLCQTCQHIERRWDGLFEEREWTSGPHQGGPKHWLAVSSLFKGVDSAKPLPELTKDAVSYVRYHSVHFCHACLGASEWPLAG